jgi:hypothetical protein
LQRKEQLHLRGRVRWEVPDPLAELPKGGCWLQHRTRLGALQHMTMARRTFVFGAAAAGFLPLSVRAQAPLVCPGTPATRLVKIHPRRPSTGTAASPDEIAQALAGSGDRRRLAAALGQPAAGSIHAEFVYELRLVLTSNDQPLRTCVVLSVAEVELHLETHRILLAPDAGPTAACRRTALLAQANRHAQINLDCLDDAQRRIEEALTRTLPSVKPVEGTSRNPAIVTRAFKRILTGPLEAALDAALASAKDRHERLTASPVLAGELGRCAG